MKLENITEGPVGLFLRIDGQSGVLEFDNMQESNIMGTADWSLYSIKLPYPKGAKTINIGALLSGIGKLWIDDFQLLIDGKDISKAKLKKEVAYKADTDKEFDTGSRISTITISESTIANLDILGKVWGFLKYHHPAVARGEYNWDYELFRVLHLILKNENQQDRNRILSEWVDILGKTEIINKENTIKKEIKIYPDLAWMNKERLGKQLNSQLKDIKNSRRKDESYYIELVPGSVVQNLKMKMLIPQ